MPKDLVPQKVIFMIQTMFIVKRINFDNQIKIFFLAIKEFSIINLFNFRGLQMKIIFLD